MNLKSANADVLRIKKTNDGRLAITFSYVDDDGELYLGNLVSHSFFNECQIEEWKNFILRFLETASYSKIRELLVFADKVESLGLI